MTYFERDREDKIALLKHCLRGGDDGREMWNGMREDSPWGLEAPIKPLTITLENNVKVSLDPPNLWLAELEGADLSGYNLSGAFLSGACLTGARLRDADLSGAHLIVSNFLDADLQGANLSRANLLDATLSRANLTNCNLAGALMLRTKVSDTCFSGSNIHGVSVWGLQGIPREQNDLVITASDEPTITVDDVEIGQFIYLILHNHKIRTVLDAITSKVVLILGRFTEERFAVLDFLRNELRKANYSPVLFDFDPAKSLDISDTVTLLARLARFVVADLTDPKCVQQELTLIATQALVPIRPIILRGHKPWAMFNDLRRRSAALLDVYEYADQRDLMTGLREGVIEPAERRRRELAALI
jgi:uncharacterized protein YjbI with pentapeptide repeats